jgi:hypothetical protein
MAMVLAKSAGASSGQINEPQINADERRLKAKNATVQIDPRSSAFICG